MQSKALILFAFSQILFSSQWLMPLQLQYQLFSNLLQMEKGEGKIKHLLFTHVWIFNIFSLDSFSFEQ